MENLTPLSIISLFETNKEERKSFVQIALNQILDGYTDIKKVHLQVKAMEEIIKTLTDTPLYKDLLIEEISKYGKKAEFYNAEFMIKEAGVKYDYSGCNDDVYADLMNQKIILDERIKEREKFLKAIPTEGIDRLDSDYVVHKTFPPVKKSTTIVQTTMK